MSQDTATLHQGLECRGNLISTEAHSETGSTLVTSPGPRDSIRQCSYGWHVQQVCSVGTNVAHMTHAIARPRKCFLNAPNRMLGCHTISDIGARCFMTGSGALLLRFTSNLACDSGDLPETCNETPLFLHDKGQLGTWQEREEPVSCNVVCLKGLTKQTLLRETKLSRDHFSRGAASHTCPARLILSA